MIKIILPRAVEPHIKIVVGRIIDRFRHLHRIAFMRSFFFFIDPPGTFLEQEIIFHALDVGTLRRILRAVALFDILVFILARHTRPQQEHG